MTEKTGHFTLSKKNEEEGDFSNDHFFLDNYCGYNEPSALANWNYALGDYVKRRVSLEDAPHWGVYGSRRQTLRKVHLNPYITEHKNLYITSEGGAGEMSGITREYLAKAFLPVPEKKKYFSRIESEIERSSYILRLEDGWDGESASRISSEIYKASIGFLRAYVEYIYFSFGIEITAPEISPLADGSIDLSWRTPSVRMLVNVKSINSVPHIFYFGDHYKTRPIKGNFPIGDFEEALAVWMKKL